MDKINFSLGLLRMLIDALQNEAGEEMQSVVKELNASYDKLVSLQSRQSLPKESPKEEKPPADDKFLQEMADKFVDPTQNPVMKEVRDSIDYHNKIKKANDSYQTEFMKANDQVKQEEIVNSLSTAIPQ